MGLDRFQEKAVTFPLDKSLFVTAPPGYGKTHVLSERIKYIVENGDIQPPNKILALTFSNAAANEMKSRVSQQFSDLKDYVDIMNFHTLAYNILKIYGNYVDVDRNFNIISEEVDFQFKRDFFDSLGWLKGEYDEQKYITDYNNWYSQNFLAKIDVEPNHPEYKELESKISSELNTSNQLNFDHILYKSIDLLKFFPRIKNMLFNKYQFILADEFQDTNYIQYSLFKEISINSNSIKRDIFVVGDEKQAIMKFQGANPKNIEYLIEDFNCASYELKENHRSASNKIKSLTDKLRYGDCDTISDLFKVYSAIKQVNSSEVIGKINSAVIDKINELKANNANYEDICILFPQEKTPEELKKSLIEEGINFIQITDYNFKSINKKYPELFREILALIENHYNEDSVRKIVKNIIRVYYDDCCDDLVLKTIKNFSTKYDSPIYAGLEVWEKLQEFYNHIQIDIDWTRLIRSKIKGKIFLSTIHSAKGLEFKYVLLIGMVNYQIPHHSLCFECNPYDNSNMVDTSDSKDLFYVGVSRAMDDIFFFFSNQGYNSSGDIKKRKLSCVFGDIKEMLTFVDVYSEKTYSYSDSKINRNLCKH
ncbi:UvrD-helicase domain-containing protein [Methanobacterium formicicum]|uniref:UvrD-helicase domain-containing protein n=1 Tax=Methanobacterium formicicum TaxID=2162 RepID=UPI002490B2D2|nr:ATP-dependent helicase [Methanobacterium formicicum]